MLVLGEDVIVLDLLNSPPLVVDGWKIVPLTSHPEIAKVDIVQFKCGRNVPACTVELEWTGSGEPKPLSHQVKISGAKKPAHFYLRYYPQAVAHEEIATGGQIRGVGESNQQTLTSEIYVLLSTSCLILHPATTACLVLSWGYWNLL